MDPFLPSLRIPSLQALSLAPGAAAAAAGGLLALATGLSREPAKASEDVLHTASYPWSHTGAFSVFDASA